MKMFYPEIRNPVLLKYIVETLLAVFGNREYLLKSGYLSNSRVMALSDATPFC